MIVGTYNEAVLKTKFGSKNWELVQTKDQILTKTNDFYDYILYNKIYAKDILVLFLNKLRIGGQILYVKPKEPIIELTKKYQDVQINDSLDFIGKTYDVITKLRDICLVYFREQVDAKFYQTLLYQTMINKTIPKKYKTLIINNSSNVHNKKIWASILKHIPKYIIDGGSLRLPFEYQSVLMKQNWTEKISFRPHESYINVKFTPNAYKWLILGGGLSVSFSDGYNSVKYWNSYVGSNNRVFVNLNPLQMSDKDTMINIDFNELENLKSLSNNKYDCIIFDHATIKYIK